MAINRQTYEYTPFDYTKFTPSSELDGVGGLKDKQINADNAYNTHVNNGFTFSQDSLLAGVMDKIFNREKFSYDVNGDALYQQYKDKYIQQGKMAMADTMGQAAAMTGGYGNSYAASVGNQAYQASLQQLNDIIPQLYQMAYDRYNQEGQDLYNQYGMLSTERSTEYGMWSDKGNMLNNNRTYYGNEYNNAYNREYGAYSDDRTVAHNEHTTSEGYKYQDVADANAFAQWQETMDFNKAQANKTVSNAPTLTASEYNDVLINAGDYASQGKEALTTYLRGMMSRGLSESEALNIYAQYFPADEIPDIPSGGKTGGSGGVGGGGRIVKHMIN